jgi:zeta-carotene desaturase
VRNNQFSSVVLEDGSELFADACVAAVTHDVLLKVLPPELSGPNAPLEGLNHLRTSPITGVHFWFDRIVMTEPFLTLLDHTTQWVFNKTLLYARSETDRIGPSPSPHTNGAPESDEQYLQLVISASYDLVQRSRQEIIDLCRCELADVLPATHDAVLRKATVIKEINATFSPEPGVDRWRPAQKSSMRNLYLAGDWTRTGWPATMEGAVRSGYLAAEALLGDSGQSQTFLRPDLAVEGLSWFWAKRNGSTRLQ